MNDYGKDLLKEIVVMRGKELPDVTATGILKIFMDCGEAKARMIIARLYDMSNIPQNIPGEIRKILATIEGEERQRTSWKERKDDNLGNNQELAQVMIFNNELILWHKLGLVEKQDSSIKKALNIDEYIAAGRPQTYSPILDHWLKGFEAAYKLDLQQEGTLYDFLFRYNQQLIKNRKEKEAATQKVAA